MATSYRTWGPAAAGEPGARTATGHGAASPRLLHAGLWSAACWVCLGGMSAREFPCWRVSFGVLGVLQEAGPFQRGGQNTFAEWGVTLAVSCAGDNV